MSRRIAPPSRVLNLDLVRRRRGEPRSVTCAKAVLAAVATLPANSRVRLDVSELDDTEWHELCEYLASRRVDVRFDPDTVQPVAEAWGR